MNPHADIRCPAPPSRWTFWDTVQLVIAELWETLSGSVTPAADLRWRRRNARESFVCQCGASATTWVHDGWPHPHNVRCVWGLCDEHRDVPLDAGWTWDGERWEPHA